MITQLLPCFDVGRGLLTNRLNIPVAINRNEDNQERRNTSEQNISGLEAIEDSWSQLTDRSSSGTGQIPAKEILWDVFHPYRVSGRLYEKERKHGDCGGFPVNSVAEVRRVIDPTWGG